MIPLIADPPGYMMTGVLQGGGGARLTPNIGPTPRPGNRALLTPNPGPSPRPGAGLINTAPNYAYPLTSGLLGTLWGAPDYSAMALQMAGNPHAGPYAQIAPPSGIGVPGPAAGGAGYPGTGGPSTGSQIVQGLLGLLGTKGGQSALGALVGLVGKGINALTGGGAASGSSASIYSGAGAPIDTSSLTSPSGYGDFGSFANSSGFDPTTGIFGNFDTSDPYSLIPQGNPFGVTSGYDPTTGAFNSPSTDPYSLTSNAGLFDDSGGFSSAGGQAATLNDLQEVTPSVSKLGGILPSLGTLYGNATGLLGAYQGLTSGTPAGELSGALKAAQLASKAGLLGNSAAAASALGAVGGGLGAYESALHGDQNGGYLSSGIDAATAGASLAGDTALASSLGPVGAAFGVVMGLDSLLNGDEAQSSAELPYEMNAANAQGKAYSALTAGASPGAYLPTGNGGTSAAGWGYDMNQLNPDLALSALIASKVTPLGGAASYEPGKFSQTDPSQFYQTLQQMGPAGLKTYGITANALAAAGYTPQQIASLGLA